MSDVEPEVESLYGWYRPRPRRTNPEPTPAFRAKIAGMREALITCDGRDEGLEPCPKCGGTKGVHQVRAAPRFRGDSGRMVYVVCPCGFRTREVYGSEPSKRAWNAIERAT